MSFYKSIVTVGGLTLGSRLLGFARDVLTAHFMGAGIVADAFFVALKLPNLFRRVTAEGAFSVSFVPLFSKELAGEGREEAKRFAEETQAVMLTVLVPFTVLAIAAMPWVIYVIAPGFVATPERYDLALEMARITFPYILFMSLTALLGGVMNSFDRFGPFAAAPMLFNAALMVALVCFSGIAETPGHAMAWGVAAAGILQFLWLLYSCRKLGMALKLQKPKITPRIRHLFKNMLPGVFGAGIAQVNLFIDLVLASLLPVGSISFLYYADRLYQLPLSVIGIAIGTALLPMLSRALKNNEGVEADRLFRLGIETGLALSLPATAAFVVIAEPMMRVLFERGAFTAADSHASALALMGYTAGLPAFVLSKVLSTAFYAREDTTTPVKFAIICAVFNTLAALCLIVPFKHVGIAFATGLAAWVNVGLLARGLHSRKFAHIGKDSVKKAAIILVSTLIMSAILWLTTEPVMEAVMDKGQIWRFLGLGFVIALGGVTYGICLYATGVLELRHLKNLFPKRKKQDTIGDVRPFGQ